VTLWYLATPYSKYPGGINAAFELACSQAGLLMRHKVPVFSPIAHTHPIAINCDMDPLDHAIWLPSDEPMMRACTGLIMLRAESWESSYGMAVEMKAFQDAWKPVVFMDPGIVPFLVLPIFRG
jgi:hypothetical protein